MHVIATAFDPRFRLVFVEEISRPAITQWVYDFCAKIVKRKDENSEESYIEISTLDPLVEDGFWESVQHKNEQDAESAPSDDDTVLIELKQYFKETNISPKTGNPLAWWKDNSVRYRKISMGARPILGIPATGTQSERVWSCGGNIVTYRRQSMSTDNIRDVLFLHENYK